MSEHLNDATADLVVPFDLDCGEVVPGRHLHLRGLVDDGTWPDALGNRLPSAAGELCRMVSLAFEVVPPVGPDDPDAAAWYGSDLARVQFEVDPELTWDVDNATGVGHCSMDVLPGRPAQRGTWGPYPLSPNARRVTFTVTPHSDWRPSPRPGAGWGVYSGRAPIGRVVIDLRDRTARWTTKPRR